MVRTWALTNAALITFDPMLPVADTLVVEGERIARVGIAADFPDELRSVHHILDLNGKTLLPGFIDTHTHVLLTGVAHYSEDFTTIRSYAEALARLKHIAAQKPPGEWIIAFGLPVGLLRGENKRMPTTADLDRVSDTSPIFVGERTGHASSLNSAGLALLDLPLDLDGVPRDSHGIPLGPLTGDANTWALSHSLNLFASAIGYERVIQAAASEALRAGLTTLHALDGQQPAADPGVQSLLAFSQEGLPRLVIYYQTRAVDAVLELGLPRIGGCEACGLDGAFTPRTANLLEPYDDEIDNRGTLYFKDTELMRFFRDAHRARLQISVHCVGDGAVDQALSAFEIVLKDDPWTGHRHRIEHAELITKDQTQRARRLGLVFAVQPAFNHFWRHDEFYPPVLGNERANRVDPLRSLVDAGLLVAGGSDSPVTPLGPLLGVHSAVNHSNPAERVDVLTALRLFTFNGACVGLEESEKGTLTAGKLADLVVLGEDPLSVLPTELKDIPIEMTVVGGQVAYHR